VTRGTENPLVFGKEVGEPQSVSKAVWRQPLLAFAFALAVLLTIFGSDAADMAVLWWNISTYQHCLYVLPIIGWLLWLRRAEVAQVTPAGWLPGLVLVFGAGLVWLVGQAGGVAIVRHVGLILMLQSCVVATLGPAVTRAILFPLFYLIFLVPFGDEFTALMQTLTARMTMALLDVTGVPASIDGVFITTRAGWFEGPGPVQIAGGRGQGRGSLAPQTRTDGRDRRGGQTRPDRGMAGHADGGRVILRRTASSLIFA
jgi:hypothetical protein